MIEYYRPLYLDGVYGEYIPHFGDEVYGQSYGLLSIYKYTTSLDGVYTIF
jgi:hypothetical protein